MTDAELIARLRSLGRDFDDWDTAADRIEALTAKVKLMDDLDAINGEKIEALEAKLATCEKYRDTYAEMDRIGTQAVRDLEAKLAENEVRLRKAVEALEYYNVAGHEGKEARATLAEIKGGNDAESNL